MTASISWEPAFNSQMASVECYIEIGILKLLHQKEEGMTEMIEGSSRVLTALGPRLREILVQD